MKSFAARLLDGSAAGITCLSALKVNDVLQQDEFKQLDDSISEPAREPLNVVADLMAAGQVFPLGAEGYMAAMQLDFQNSKEFQPANIVMDAITQNPRDRVEFNTFSVPLPLIMSEFAIGARNLAQSRKLGLPLDTINAREAARQVSVAQENLVVNGNASFSFKGKKIEGLTTAANRLTATFETTGNAWNNAAKTGEQILTDVLNLIQTAENNKFFGPYALYFPRDASTKMNEDFKANSDKTVIERVRQIDGLQSVKVADKLASGNVVLVQMSSGNSVELITGFEPQVISWQGNRGPFITDWAVMSGLSVRIHTDGGTGKQPIVHMTV